MAQTATIPIRIIPHDPWSDTEGMAPMDVRLERSARAAAMARAIPKLEPTEREADRQRSDDAMRGLVAGLLTALSSGGHQ